MYSLHLSKDVQQGREPYQDPTIYGIGILTFLTGEVDLVHEPTKLKNPRLLPPVAKSSLMSGFVKTQIKRQKKNSVSFCPSSHLFSRGQTARKLPSILEVHALKGLIWGILNIEELPKFTIILNFRLLPQ